MSKPRPSVIDGVEVNDSTADLDHHAELLKLYEVRFSAGLQKAQTGDRKETLSMLAILSGLLRTENPPIPVKAKEWLADGLEGLSMGLTAEESFKFTKAGKGRKAASALRVFNERRRRAYLVELLAATKGSTIEQACEQVATRENVSPDTVNKAWDTERQWAHYAVHVSLGDMYWAREIK